MDKNLILELDDAVTKLRNSKIEDLEMNLLDLECIRDKLLYEVEE